MYGWDKDGNPLPGFPLTGQDAINTQAMIGDLDNDNKMEFIFEDNLHQGRYHLHNHDATEMELYTVNPDGSTFFNNPTLSDADGDGDLDISAAINDVQTQIGDLYFWDVPVFYSEEFMPLPVLQYNNRHTGVYGEYNWTITGIEKQRSEQKIKASVYPNPCRGYLYLHSNEDIQSVFVLNQHGQTVLELNSPSKFMKINTGNFQSGIYFIRFNFPETFLVRKVLVKN
jgi:hypothetical protein